MQKKWALITGASSGIGAATAEALAKQGYSLILTARRKNRLDELIKNLSKQFSQNQTQNQNQPKNQPSSPSQNQPTSEQKFIAFEMDITERKDVENLVNTHKEELSNLVVLVNNAGLAAGVDKMQDARLQDWDTMIDTNVKGLLAMTRAVLPQMIANKKGHIVNLGSVAGRWTYPGGGVYCATKFAVRALSEGLRMDLLGTGLRVTNIEPGMVNTEFSTVRLGDAQKADQVYAGMTPLSAQDIAETIAWCIERPAHVNIQELVIYPTDQAHVGQVFRR